MFKHAFFTLTLAALLGLSSAAEAAEAVALRDLAGCKPGADDPIVTSEGMFRVHLVCDHLLLQIHESMYGRDMLLNIEFAGISGGGDSISPGTLVDSRVIRFIRRGAKVNIVIVKFDIASARAPGITRGVEATSLNTVLQSVDIVGRGSNGEAVIDVTPMFVIKPPPSFAVGFMKQFGMSEIDPARSFIEKVKAFPDSVSIDFQQQTWVADRGDLMRRTGEGEDTVTASMGFSFATDIYLLPEKPMRPRFADPRVGYFTTDFQDYGTGATGGKARGYIQRYRLEKKNPKAPLSDPVRPIVFYIDRDVPEVWRPYLKQAVEGWQGVFSKAGFSNAIFARDAPTAAEDASWDPDDVRHNVIRWTPSGRKNALGAAVVDPRSGEVVSSHTLLWHDVLKLIETWYFTQASPLDPRAQKLPLPTELMGELLTYVIRHEIGHALGLRHNFKASSAVTARNLRDPKWTAIWGTSASTMSYARFNYVAQPGDGASLIPKLGPYDYFAIEWGYSQFPDNWTHDEEEGRLDEIAVRQVTDPMLRFGGEDDAAEVDPSVFSNVLCGEPIECGDLGLRNIDRVMSFIVPATTRTGEGYEKLSTMYEALVQQRHHELTYVARMVGGVVETRYQAGRGTVPFVPLDPARQRQAVNFLVKRAFAEPKALLDPDVLYRISFSGGSTPLQGSNVELLRHLIDPNVFLRMTEASSMGRGRYAAIDMLSDLNDGLFSELATKAPAVTPYRRQVQRSYVTVLLTGTGNVNDPSGASANIESANTQSANVESAPVDSGTVRKSKQKSNASNAAPAQLRAGGYRCAVRRRFRSPERVPSHVARCRGATLQEDRQGAARDHRCRHTQPSAPAPVATRERALRLRFVDFRGSETGGKMDPMKTLSCLRLFLVPVVLAALLAAAPLPAAAQSADDNWHFSVVPYFWLPTISGTLQFRTPGGTNPEVGFKVDPSEYAPDIKMALPLALEARKGKWLAYSDVLYMNLGANASTVKDVNFGGNVVSTNVDLGTSNDLKATIWTLAGGYNLVQDPKVSLDLIAGARYLYLKSTTNWQLTADVTDPGTGKVFSKSGSATDSGDVLDGIVGVKGRVKLGEGSWFVPYYLDAGTGDSQYTWQADTGIGYAFRWGDLVLNYRYLAWEADDNSKTVQDLKLYGFGIAGVFHF